MSQLHIVKQRRSRYLCLASEVLVTITVRKGCNVEIKYETSPLGVIVSGVGGVVDIGAAAAGWVCDVDACCHVRFAFSQFCSGRRATNSALHRNH
jgi:hypothetical protein